MEIIRHGNIIDFQHSNLMGTSNYHNVILLP